MLIGKPVEVSTGGSERRRAASRAPQEKKKEKKKKKEERRRKRVAPWLVAVRTPLRAHPLAEG